MRWLRAAWLRRQHTIAYIAVVVASAFSLWQVGPVAEREACQTSNRTRAEIRQAFATLGDQFIAATGGRQDAIDFKRDLLADLDLPQRKC